MVPIFLLNWIFESISVAAGESSCRNEQFCFGDGGADPPCLEGAITFHEHVIKDGAYYGLLMSAQTGPAWVLQF